jgi:hypothetical protein
LLGSIGEFSQPLGPAPEAWAERDRLQAEWERSLSVSDYLLLLDWMRESQCPPDWDAAQDRWLSGYAAHVAFIVGRAARSCRDRQLLSRLLDLLADPARANRATEIVFDMESLPELDLLLAGVADQRVPIFAELAGVATATQVAALRAAEQSTGLGSDAKATIRAILANCPKLRTGQARGDILGGPGQTNGSS